MIDKPEDTDNYEFVFNADNSCTIISKIPTDCGRDNLLAEFVFRAVDTQYLSYETSSNEKTLLSTKHKNYVVR